MEPSPRGPRGWSRDPKKVVAEIATGGIVLFSVIVKVINMPIHLPLNVSRNF